MSSELKEQIVREENLTMEEMIQSSERNENPFNWSKKRKVFTLSVVGCAAMSSLVSNTIIYPSLLDIAEKLHTTEFLSNVLVSVSIFFSGIAPIGWASYSDIYETRKKVYIASTLMFVITSVICAVATNIWLLLVMRGLQASAVTASQCIGAGTITDIYTPIERGTAYGYFNLIIVIGPLIGPIIGGYVTDYLGWRWIFWLLSIFGSLILIFLLIISDTFNRKEIYAIKEDTTTKEEKKFNPFAPLRMLKYPNVMLINIYVSINSGICYIQIPSIPRNFREFYGLSASKAGLIFISFGIGQILGSVVGGKWSDMILVRFKNRNSGKIVLEQRIHSVWIGSIIVPLILAPYGWLMERRIHIAFPIALLFFSGFSSMVIQSSMSTYLIDSYPNQSASVISTHVLFKSVVGIISLVSIPLQNSIGLGWTFTSLSIISFLSILFVIIVYFKGSKWRENQMKL